MARQITTFQEWLNIDQAAEYLGVSRRSILNAIQLCKCNIANVDLKYPIIIVKGMNNYNKKYTSLDGRHRLLKLITQKLDYVNAYILEEGDVKSVWNRKYGE